jgi:hypothetical protein
MPSRKSKQATMDFNWNAYISYFSALITWIHWAKTCILPVLKTETLLVASKEVGLEVSAKKTKYIFSAETEEIA